MSDDGEIEFLDEDADIVQQCVQNVDEPILKPVIETTLLVERVKNEKPRRKRKKEEDSDYDPSEDIIQRNRKKRQQNFPRQGASRGPGRPPNSSYLIRNDVKEVRKTKKYVAKGNFFDRKKLDIKIPDYDDPLCLPVRALKKDEWDARKLRNWNNLCLDNFKNYDKLLRAEKEPTVSSKRTVVLRNMFNKMTGKNTVVLL